MESPFARYSGQGIQPVTGMAEAGANIGQMYGNAIANFGKSISDGLQRYQENVQKDQILTQEAEALADQIFAFQNQFRDPTTGQLNQEYAPFAQSLQPHIDKLSKVPSMSLAQKMGTVTGVKAAFANISPQLQAFEMMRNVRLQQDFNKAQAGVREFDTVSVPTAIIPEGKMPYYYNKSYQENEAAFTDLAKQAIAGGAKIDLNDAIEKWRNQIKGGTMANNNLPPAIKEGLIKQIDAAKGLEENVQTDESGVTDYGKESEMYDATRTSVKGQLEAASAPAPAPKMGWNADKTLFTSKMGDNIVTIDRMGKAVSSTPIPKTPMSEEEELRDRRMNIGKAIDALSPKKPAYKSLKTYTTDEVNAMYDKGVKEGKINISRFQWELQNIQELGINKDSGRKDFALKSEYNTWKEGRDTSAPVSKSAKDSVKFYQKETEKIDKRLNEISVGKTAKQELANIDELIANADAAIQNEETTSTGWMTKVSDAVERGVFDGINKFGLKEQARIAIDQGSIDKVTPDYARRLVKDASGGMGGLAIIGSIITPDLGNAFGIKDAARKLTKEEERNIEAAVDEFRSKQGITRSVERGDAEALKEKLLERKGILEKQVATGKLSPTASEVAAQSAKAQQAQQAAAKQALPEQLAVSNLGAFSLGSRQEQVATTLESKRKDLSNFFMQKYGYVPAGFEQSFKAMYPEAQFKTMETPYGAFMYDGKEWKQIATPTPAKPRSAKEVGEERSYVFGTQKADGSQDFKEFLSGSGVYMRGIFEGSEKEKQDFRDRMYAASRAKKTVGRLIEINNQVGESMPWNAALQGEAKALLPEIMAALRPEIVGVGTVSNYEQEMIRDVVADPTKFWSLESSDRAKLLVIASRIDNTISQLPTVYGLEVKVSGQSNAEKEQLLRQQMMSNKQSQREQEYNNSGKINWNR